jgi:hypothetical protein
MLYAISTSVQLGCNSVTFETDSAQLKTAAATEDYDLAALGAIQIYYFQLRMGLLNSGNSATQYLTRQRVPI